MKHYSTPSWSPALLNVALIGACLLFRNRFAEPAYALVVGVWLGGVSQLIVQYIALGRHTGVWLPNFRLRHPAIRASLWLLLPVIIGQAAGEVNKLVDSLFAASLGDGSVTALYYANRLVQLPLAMFGIAISAAILPGISRAAARGDFEEVRGTLIHGLRQCYFLICPALVALTVIPRPIVTLLFQRGHFDAADSDRTAVALLFYAGGLLCFAWVKVVVAGFYAVKNTRVPVAIASASMLLNIALNFSLVRPMGFAGLALATTISYSVNFLALYVLLARRHGRLWDAPFLSALARITVAGILTGMAMYGTGIFAARLALGSVLIDRFTAVAVPLSAGGAAYFGSCFVLRVPDLRAFLGLLRKR